MISDERDCMADEIDEGSVKTTGAAGAVRGVDAREDVFGFET